MKSSFSKKVFVHRDQPQIMPEQYCHIFNVVAPNMSSKCVRFYLHDELFKVWPSLLVQRCNTRSYNQQQGGGLLNSTPSSGIPPLGKLSSNLNNQIFWHPHNESGTETQCSFPQLQSKPSQTFFLYYLSLFVFDKFVFSEY